MTIKILNAPAGGHPCCGPKHALRYVKQGRATWVIPNVSIQMIEAHHAHRQVVETLDQRIMRHGYDAAVQTGALRQKHLKRLPMAGNVSRMGVAA